MSFTPTAGGQKLKEAALTKMLVYFNDGNARTWYGRHESNKYTPVDPKELEIKRLKRYAESVAGNIRIAILYDLASGQEVARFKNGTWV